MQANEQYRLKKMAALCTGDLIADIGFAQSPNPFLQARQLVGIDPAAELLPANYQQMYCGTLQQYSEANPEIKFETVLAGELLEHLFHPMQFLQQCFDALQPGGRLVLSTPNPNSPIERLLTLQLNRRFFYTKDHLMLFPQRWLVRMLETTGFTDCTLLSGGFPCPFIGLIPFPRPWCYQTIAVAIKPR